MKTQKLLIQCEFCDQPVAEHLSKEGYENAQVFLGENSTILLPKRVVKKNHKKGFSDSHAKSIDGYYCNPECLISYIKKILNRK